jgi:hypothetical protein
VPRYAPVNRADPYPEHAKLAMHMESNWSIKDFLSFMADRGVFLSRVVSGKVVHVTEAQVEGSIMEFRGVDIPTYQAESQALMVKYGANMPDVLAGTRPKDTDADYPSMIRIISLLDSLGVPAWAGRPTCRDALREGGFSLPETGLFARAVKLRKSMYGVVSSVSVIPVQEELPLPAPEPEQPVDAAMMLRKFMTRQKEEANAQAS